MRVMDLRHKILSIRSLFSDLQPPDFEIEALAEQRRLFEDWCLEARADSTGRESLQFRLRDSASLLSTVDNLLRDFQEDLWGKDCYTSADFYISRNHDIVADKY